MEITAAVLRAPHTGFSVETVELETPREDECLIRIRGVGICHTDLTVRDELLPTPLPAVLGHEGSGVVEQVGRQVTHVKPGDHVVLSFASCGACPSCTRGTPSYCAEFAPRNFGGIRADGSKAIKAGGAVVSSHFFGQSSFASHALASVRNVVKVRRDAPLELLGPLGCGVQTGAGSIMRALGCEAGSSLAVLGGGSVGLSGVMAAVVQGCAPIIVVEPHAVRRALALELGATHVIDPAAGPDLTAAIRALAPHGVDYAFDTTGLQRVFTAATMALTPRGTIGLVAVPPADQMELKVDVMTLLLQGYRLKGIAEGDVDPAEFIPRLVDLFVAGRFPLDKLCTTYPLADINRAIEDQHAGVCVKPVLVP